ncbi:hypothetical protein [Streptomyces erythrochromogenes]|uniref:hypothetical protein n=1 Tax=Streptomyces erythrochromogenes TaxID=285574 RepID=UPI0036F55134
MITPATEMARPHTPPATPTTGLRLAAAYEWHHLKGLRSTWIILITVGVLAIGNGVSLMLASDAQTAPTPAAVADAIQWSPTATQLPLLALILITIGTGSVSTDLTRKGASTTWLTTTSRPIAFAAKAAVASLLVTAAAMATALIAISVGALALAFGGGPQPAWADALPATGRYALVMACWPLIAASTAALLRNRTATVLALVTWPLIIERITGALLGRLLGAEGLPGFLPFAAARAAMSGAPDTGDGADADAALNQALIGSTLQPWTGLAVYMLYALVIAATGAWSYSRRDAP